jgi:tRNA pseudouridine55 synthase
VADGLLIVDKPAGPTSHDVVARMRRALRETRIGHTGTLDPMATGVLLLVVGKATRLAKFLSAGDKSYDAVVRFGFATDTADAQGRPLGPVSGRAMPAREAIDAALDAFRGTFMQQPPAFSAKKIDGQRSYKLARAARLKPSRDAVSVPTDLPDLPGLTARPDLPAACSVTTTRLEIVSVEADTVTLSLDCSAGFYVRSLAHDLGERLGVGAHLTALRRTRTGDFALERAITLDAAERNPDAAAAALVPLAGMLNALPSVMLTPEGASRVAHGQDIRPGDQQVSSLNSQPSALSPEPFIRLLSPGGGLLAIARPEAGGALHPSVVLV